MAGAERSLDEELSMKLATVAVLGIPRVVARGDEGQLVDLARLSDAMALGPQGFPRDMLDLLTAGILAGKFLDLCQDAIVAGKASDFAVSEALVRWKAPVPRPPKIVCINSNRPSARVDQLEPKLGGRWPRPQFFLKAATAVVGHRENIIIDTAMGKVQPEGELCLIIGRRGRRISRDTALDYIAGVSLLNDISASAFGLQDGVIHRLKGKDGAVEDMINRPLARAKGVDTFSPFGPWLVPLADVGDLDAVRVTTRLAGKGEDPVDIQDGVMGAQRWSPAEAVATVSEWMTLEPGDVIAMGSMEMAPNYYLRKGDLSQYHLGHIELEATGIGLLVSPIHVDHEEEITSAP